MARRVAVTGIGICAPVGFAELIQGGHGLAPAADWQIPDVSLRLGRVPGDVPARVRDLPGSWRPDRLDPVSHFALLAADAAREDAGLARSGSGTLEEAAVVIASAMGGEHTHYDASRQLVEHHLTGRKIRISPFTAPKLMPNAASANVAMHLEAHGPNVSPAAACASGAYAIAQAADLIRSGRVAIAVAGASEAPCQEITARAFLAGEALSPTGESRPFHVERNGFVLGEGAAILILEEMENARARGARIHAELAGSGLTCDAYHIVAPHPDGRHAAMAMRQALREAGLSPRDVGYVNAHATGTSLGDIAECNALRELFDSRPPLISSTKGATGHLLGAAGALEACYTILALQRGLVPPTLRLENTAIDPACAEGGFDFVAGSSREIPLRAAMSNSFAFGGHNACLLFTKV